MLVAREQDLSIFLRDLPTIWGKRYTDGARQALLRALFLSLAGDNEQYLRLFFPNGVPAVGSGPWSLRIAQGAVEGAEYTPAAKGHRCGHIFKSGEATYRCKTCSMDDTCVLCAKCFDASDHEDHTVFVSVSVGNSGCCDCGDPEAWNRMIHCNIHTDPTHSHSKAAGKAKEGYDVPEPLLHSIRRTIARALDYLCDVFSCSPEQLRLTKTEESVRMDERVSRLTSNWYGGGSPEEEDGEFALVLWNDEKHTVIDVRDQVARACKKSKSFGMDKAHEVDDAGRAIIEYSTNLKELLRMAKVIEEIKVTVTIRSARDTFREQMCATIIEWISDISGCVVGTDPNVLRNVICEEMLKDWRMGSEGSRVMIGMEGLDDHETEDNDYVRFSRRVPGGRPVTIVSEVSIDDSDENDVVDDDNEHISGESGDDDEMDVDEEARAFGDGDLMDLSDEPQDYTEASEATYAGYPPPPPPPPPTAAVPARLEAGFTPVGSDDGVPVPGAPILATREPFIEIPRTPKLKTRTARLPRPPRYWLEKPEGYSRKSTGLVHEDLWQRVRLDYLILYDLRMWKKLRIDLRDLYITTVVTIPYFKRVLGLRFAGLYTPLAQLYLIADREPDHSIIMLSLQMLTTPSITAEVVERGNFLTNLMAILYTFLTTRQVGYPSEVNPHATLAFEAGAVTNRRMYHFFQDMKYLLASECVKDRVSHEERYLVQFLDLVKLHQGICPNVRAVGEHLEYETDAWISASLITREINRLCRQISEAFVWRTDDDEANIRGAIRRTAKIAIVNSMGCERRRFINAEIKSETKFKKVDGCGFNFIDKNRKSICEPQYMIVNFLVEREHMSFHHALHYTLSWLVERGKSMTRQELQGLLLFSVQQLKEAPLSFKTTIAEYPPENYLLALFDFPLRVCAWLAQMRAGLWVRNGITLRHQMSQYRGVLQRDVSYQRDIFLLQVALVVCSPATMLASMVDRFGLTQWMMGNYHVRSGYEDHQMIDIAEDFIHLLIILLSERNSLVPIEDEPRPHTLTIQRDIAHALCFKPLSYSELTNRLPERVHESDDFQDVLREMTSFRPPEGMSDSGTFELRDHYIEDIDPYNSQYTRNQREEAENIYKAHVAKHTGQQPADVVFMPKLRPIVSGLFVDLAAFTQTLLFARVIYFCLGYALAAERSDPNVPVTRLEGYIQFVLQLILLATSEDKSTEESTDEDSPQSFVYFALSGSPSPGIHGHRTIVSILHALCTTEPSRETFKPCMPKIGRIFDCMKAKQPQKFAAVMQAMGHPLGRQDDAAHTPVPLDEKEAKKKQALARQARVMAQFKEQQMNFMENQALAWGEDDFSDLDDYPDTPDAAHDKTWKFPSGTCILCQEETDDQRVYGTFGFIADSGILRQTDLNDGDWVAESANTPTSLDRSAEDERPFGVAKQNRRHVQKTRADGSTVLCERQELGKGFPSACSKRGPVTTGCGHIMHFCCFDVYVQATQRRHASQIARCQPERLQFNEFLCPLCKALGNVFLPIIWKPKTVRSVEEFVGAANFEDWLKYHVVFQKRSLEKEAEKMWKDIKKYQKIFENASDALITPLASALNELSSLSLSPGPSHVPLSVPHRAMQLQYNPLPLDEPQTRVFGYQEVRPPNPPSSPLEELVSIYQRLRHTMITNCITAKQANAMIVPPSDFTHSDTLVKSLGYTISAFEIAQRGVESEPGSIFLDKLSSQYLTHLRVLSETVTSYFAVGGHLHHSPNPTTQPSAQQYFEMQNLHMHQLLVGQENQYWPGAFPLGLKSIPSLFSQDVFIHLVQSCIFLAPALGMDIHSLIRLSYLAEIVKVVVAVLQNPKGVLQQAARAAEDKSSTVADRISVSDEQLQAFSAFVQCIALQCTNFKTPAEFDGDLAAALNGQSNSLFYPYLHNLTASYALPFVRKVALLAYARFDVEFPASLQQDSDLPELVRLSNTLRLPSLQEMFVSFVRTDFVGSITRSLSDGWIRHWSWEREGRVRGPNSGISISHPAIFELVGLPRNYDTLTDEAMRRRCPTTGKDLTDPCVCLFCGEIFCSQAVCCMKDMKGGCTQHLAK